MEDEDEDVVWLKGGRKSNAYACLNPAVWAGAMRARGKEEGTAMTESQSEHHFTKLS